jgi:PHP family Zn ribbon phosphoesterase
MPVEFRADLHIHTCLSPCADLSMTPRGIVEKASSKGINIIAICDHNSAENVGPAARLAKGKGIMVIAGIEVSSAEEVHVLGLFGDPGQAMKMQEIVYENLQPGENDEEAFGMQVVVNEEDEVLGFNRRLLIGATRLSVNEVVKIIHELQGLSIASHIDRAGFGIIGQLGFIPDDIAFDALEISPMTGHEEALQRFGTYRSVPWVFSSDAHEVGEIGRSTTGFLMNHGTFEEMRLALAGEGGRTVIP